MPKHGVRVARGMTHDGLGHYLAQVITKAPGPTADIAGILRDTTFHKMTRDDWDLIYRVHVLGAFRVTHAACIVVPSHTIQSSAPLSISRRISPIDHVPQRSVAFFKSGSA